ncbi:MAG: hypothetical protein SGI71_09985 [Verrucomicrobiota bacterium]|nr:hypothetical protein [Verrucomicrobiota bacterium]
MPIMGFGGDAPFGAFRTRSFRGSHAGGMKACSRWLSEVTPPDDKINMNRTPAGVPANGVAAKVP